MKNIYLLISSLLLLTACNRQGYSQLKIGLEEFASSFSKPVDIANNGDSRLFVVEQAGRIRIVDGKNNVLSGHFLDIRNMVKSSGGEQGLLGLAFHPDYMTNGYFFVNYTGPGDSTHISRFKVSVDANKADSLSEERVISIAQPYSNHNGGCIKFGPDGYLYIGMGDGGSGGDPQGNGQNMNTLLGKMLRLDVDNLPYSIPSANPFFSQSGVKKEIWALGLRNPWRFSFDRETGDLWIADVGQNAWEEINLQMASSAGGENYGWRCYEADDPYNTSGCSAPTTYEYPVAKYVNSGFGGDCSVTGGYRYRGNNFPGMEGFYFMADYCSNKIWTVSDSSGTWITTYLGQFGSNNFSTFGEDSDGELYIAGLSTGKIYRIIDSATVLAVERKNENQSARIFPNPFSGELNIITAPVQVGILTVIIYSIEGRELKAYQLKNGSNVLDLTWLERGIYMVSLTQGKNNNIFKVLKN